MTEMEGKVHPSDTWLSNAVLSEALIGHGKPSLLPPFLGKSTHPLAQ